ncbi:Na+/citrate or Na+/malate symporter [Dethiosulfatibacter aminovorans DSM 17477]|uniref:Na+/citrate or Na+/malate symporter n=1 Tax=Dethiosulfatibacter aminovorans DSM 17477 TaxID=1121476 RepID=A0A1M6DS71_9FIRM|nr:2-hydroxycarboxylate transporter family protein [Dethiosulfatibacter aminovorans]SHI75858.1 Na+/citrate or Na+/malate symporter [Dethiosulfatibacter aminovorans DSM 17477]
MINEKARETSKRTLIIGMTPSWFLLFGTIIMVAAYLGKLPNNLIGGFAVCMFIGSALSFVANKIPFIKNTIGGVAAIAFTCAILNHFHVFPENLIETVKGFVGGNTSFITFYISGLICGSLLGIDRNLLIKAGSRYFIPITAGIIGAYALAGLVGQVAGIGWKESILYIAAPIMGGGTGGGAIPMSEIYGTALGTGNEVMFSKIYPAVTLGGISSLVFAGVLNSLGKKKPSLSGNGVLMKGFTMVESEEYEDDDSMTITDLGTGLFMSSAFFIFGRIVGNFVPVIHYYAFIIITVALAKITGIVPKKMELAALKWYKFLVKNFTLALMAGVGITMISIQGIIDILSPIYLIVCIATVVGGFLGAGIVGRLVNFFFIESAITAGLCMSNVGGNGDVAILSASERMNLMPFAQISSRLGGALILIIQSFLIRILAG